MALLHATSNPWLTIWTRPRGTIRRIVEADPRQHVLLLAGLSGFDEALNLSSKLNAGDHLPMAAVIALCAVVGPLAGVIELMLLGWALSWAGRRVGGHASNVETRAALAWGNVPILWTSLVWVVYIALYGSDVFTSTTPYIDTHPALSQVMPVLESIREIAWWWAAVARLKCIGEVNGFSAWTALGANLLAGLLLTAAAIPVLCVVIGFVMLLR